MARAPNILLLSDEDAEIAVMQKIFGGYPGLTCIKDLSALQQQLNLTEFDVLLCSDGLWNDVMRTVQELRPELPVIVLSRTATERKWVEVIESGAFDLLAPPFAERTLLSAVEQAAASYHARVERKGFVPRTQRAS